MAGCPRPLLRAGGYEDLGVALLERDGRDEAAVLLDRAWEIYHDIGATGPLLALQDTMRKAGFHRARWAPAAARPANGWGSLTPAEVRVARLISAREH
ncbi:hypothetical protein AB0M46_10060 [Dactylosporangium sp. NPDC051485]|uniref:hypothetical protein n=1 Tax=Dactylosporangium sp. NPDC051485 TaxID=3154846 RepID=UPI0034287059